MQDSWLRCGFSWIENAFLLAKGRFLRIVNKTQMVNNSKDCLIRQQNIHSVAPEYCIFWILLFLYICTLQLHISDLLWRLQISPVYRIFIPSDGFDSSHSWKFLKHEQNKNDYFEKIFTKFEETSQELRMLSSVTINCQVTMIVMNPGSQLSVL